VITFCALLLNLAGAALVYLASARQMLLAKTLSTPARLLGWLCIVAGLVCWLLSAGMGPGIAAAMTTLMLAWAMLPYLAWWRVSDAMESQRS
jgi:hypothetical protein